MAAADALRVALAVYWLTAFISNGFLIAGLRARWYLWTYGRFTDYDPHGWDDIDDMMFNPTRWDELVAADIEQGCAPKLAYIVRCWWCLPVWLTAPLVAVMTWWPNTPTRFTLDVLAIAAGIALTRIVFERISR